MKTRKEFFKNLHKKVMDHWYTNLMLAYAGELSITDVDNYSCDYCKKFGRSVNVRFKCVCCPVCLRTGCTGCFDTPWSDVVDALPDYNNEDTKKIVKNVIKQIEFLESLREDEL